MNNSPFDIRAARRLALLQHGGLGGTYGKTGLALLRHSEEKIVAVIDRENAGRSLREVTGLPLNRDIPIVGDIMQALPFEPEAIAIGIAPSGGRLPEAWLTELRAAVRAGVSIWNGLHFQLRNDPAIAAGLRPGVEVWDMRQEPVALTNGRGLARDLRCQRVLFVGTDMAVGKMTAALELHRAASARGLRSRFVATGQAGMMISGAGICLDAVRVDFASGAIEAEVLRHGPASDFLWIEGQGSLLNPASTATLALMRGTQPTHLILVHLARMNHLQDFPDIPVPRLDRVVALYETVAAAAGAFSKAEVAGIAINTWGLTASAAQAEIAAVAAVTDLPCSDPVRFGADPLLDAVLASHRAPPNHSEPAEPPTSRRGAPAPGGNAARERPSILGNRI